MYAVPWQAMGMRGPCKKGPRTRKEHGFAATAAQLWLSDVASTPDPAGVDLGNETYTLAQQDVGASESMEAGADAFGLSTSLPAASGITDHSGFPVNAQARGELSAIDSASYAYPSGALLVAIYCASSVTVVPTISNTSIAGGTITWVPFIQILSAAECTIYAWTGTVTGSPTGVITHVEKTGGGFDSAELTILALDGASGIGTISDNAVVSPCSRTLTYSASGSRGYLLGASQAGSGAIAWAADCTSENSYRDTSGGNIMVIGRRTADSAAPGDQVLALTAPTQTTISVAFEVLAAGGGSGGALGASLSQERIGADSVAVGGSAQALQDSAAQSSERRGADGLALVISDTSARSPQPMGAALLSIAIADFGTSKRISGSSVMALPVGDIAAKNASGLGADSLAFPVTDASARRLERAGSNVPAGASVDSSVARSVAGVDSGALAATDCALHSAATEGVDQVTLGATTYPLTDAAGRSLERRGAASLALASLDSGATAQRALAADSEALAGIGAATRANAPSGAESNALTGLQYGLSDSSSRSFERRGAASASMSGVDASARGSIFGADVDAVGIKDVAGKSQGIQGADALSLSTLSVSMLDSSSRTMERRGASAVSLFSQSVATVSRWLLGFVQLFKFASRGRVIASQRLVAQVIASNEPIATVRATNDPVARVIATTEEP
jgi:hypothetical protein